MTRQIWLRFTLLLIEVGLYRILADDSYLTNYRDTKIRFLFTHNIPFEDMRHLQSRAQRMGILFETRFQNRERVTLFPHVTANFTGIIEDYIKTAIELYTATNPVVPTLGKIMRSHLKLTQHDPEYLWYIILNYHEIEQAAHYKLFYDIFFNEVIAENRTIENIDGEFVQSPEPLFMYIMKAWKVFYMLALSSSHEWIERIPNQWSNHYYGELTKIHDEWSLMFIDELCKAMHRHSEITFSVPNGFCPDPCISQPCFGIPNTASSKCTPTGTQWNEFNCSCLPPYTWIRPPNSVGHCQMDDPCLRYCNVEGTRRCDVVDQKEFCVCRPTHMGPTCELKRDPCIELSSPTEIPGNVACNVNRGGQCVGTLGTNTYYCICPSSFTSDPSYPLPNCLAFKDRCLSIICVHGDCISSKDGQEVYCSCPDESYGEFCELVRGKWAQWSPWSECTPACGITQSQRRVRTRDCLGEACRGGEGHLQMEMCETTPCPDETLALSRQGRSEEISELKVQMLQAQAARCVKLVGAVGQALMTISCVFAAAAATAMAVSVHLM